MLPDMVNRQLKPQAHRREVIDAQGLHLSAFHQGAEEVSVLSY